MAPPSPTPRFYPNRLRGNVYLRSSTGKLPDLVADLYSGAVRIVIEGHIGPTKQGGVDAFFDELPDQPLDRFVMTLRGGKHGLLDQLDQHLRRPSLRLCLLDRPEQHRGQVQHGAAGDLQGEGEGSEGKAAKPKGKGSKGTGAQEGR